MVPSGPIFTNVITLSVKGSYRIAQNFGRLVRLAKKILVDWVFILQEIKVTLKSTNKL